MGRRVASADTWFMVPGGRRGFVESGPAIQAERYFGRINIDTGRPRWFHLQCGSSRLDAISIVDRELLEPAVSLDGLSRNVSIRLRLDLNNLGFSGRADYRTLQAVHS